MYSSFELVDGYWGFERLTWGVILYITIIILYYYILLLYVTFIILYIIIHILLLYIILYYTYIIHILSYTYIPFLYPSSPPTFLRSTPPSPLHSLLPLSSSVPNIHSILVGTSIYLFISLMLWFSVLTPHVLSEWMVEVWCV